MTQKPNDFGSYLASLPRTPCVEAIIALYESLGTLRKPTPEELSEFVSMASETEHRMRGDWDSNREAIVDEDKEFIEQVSNGTFQAVTDGNGIIIYGEADGRMYVYLLFVRPECRRTGTAQRLMEYIKSQAGGKPIALSVNNHNDAARALYKKLGMADSKTFGYDGYDIIEMQSPLTESVEDTALTPFDDAIDIAKDSYDRTGGMDYEPEEGEDEESKYTVVKNTVDCIYGEMEAQLKSKGTVTVYRALSAKELKDIRMDYLGESWSLYEDTAIEFGSHNGSNFILKAEAGLDAIDLERTWEVAGACADLDEYEVCIEDTDRLKDLHIGRIVKRTAVYDIK